MPKTIRSGAREVIYNVYLRCLAENKAGRVLTRLQDVYTRVAEMTGKSESSVRRIVDEGVKGGQFVTPGKHKQGRPRKHLDDFDLCAIRQTIQFFYTVKKEAPTLASLLACLRQDIGYTGSREHLRKLLKSIGFSYRKTVSSRSVLIEKPHIAAKREEYLKIILDNRNLPEELQKDIIYIDESYIHSSYRVKKCWQSTQVKGVLDDVSKGKRWILVHAGSKKRFVPNAVLVFSGNNKKEDYHSEMNRTNFTKWTLEKLVPNLPEPSIIVMDNAPYHSVVINKAPTSANKIADIKLWLLKNNIPFDPDLRKPSLLMLVKRHKPKAVYEIDELLSEHGHTVVRLPPYHCDLNPIELIWAQVKKKVALRNVGGTNVQYLIIAEFNNVTTDDWNKCCEHVVKIEKEYYQRGKTLYDDIDRLVIPVQDESSSDDYDRNDDTEESDNDRHRNDSMSDASNISGVEYLDFEILNDDN